MKLSEINWINKDKIIKDMSFEALGILDSITDLDLCSFIEEEKYIERIKKNVTVLITNSEIYSQIKDRNIGFYIVDNPKIVFFELHNYMSSNKICTRKDYKTIIGKNCDINESAYIAENNVTIGNNVIIEEFASIKENTTIGNNCIIGAGSIIGGSGFEYKRNENRINSVRHMGGVILENNVEIKYNVVIDRAIYPWDNTIIKEYTKVDNLNHIAHACKIGKRVLIPAGSTIGGRVTIEDDSWIGIGCSIRNGLIIGKNARCNMGAVVTKNVEDNGSVTGNFAVDHEIFINSMKKIKSEAKK